MWEIFWILMLFVFGIALALTINYRWSKCKAGKKVIRGVNDEEE